ncbi:MAG TPA: DUF3189 family protein [Syntrophomonas sp.]|nr:DUF3189 family protein [Syntrophomonas sp.]HRW11710.1 DUF3189 family protein [Syntrophomonas sp.]
MKIIYHCFGGSHSSVTAAALHLGLLSRERLPTAAELMALPYYDKTSNGDFGSIHYMGSDEDGNEVYILGKKSLGNRFGCLLRGVAEILGKDNQLLVVNVMDRVNASMKLGGFTSRRIGIPALGRPVVIQGTQQAFEAMCNLVETVKISVLDCRQR